MSKMLHFRSSSDIDEALDRIKEQINAELGEDKRLVSRSTVARTVLREALDLDADQGAVREILTNVHQATARAFGRLQREVRDNLEPYVNEEIAKAVAPRRPKN